MRLSYVSTHSSVLHRQHAVEYARIAEESGYESVWVPEAFGSDAFTLLGLLAGQTSRLRLATGIVNVFSRTPSVLAQSFATLDELSGGRAIIGLGTSGPVVIENWHGLKFEKPLLRTRETVEILRLALAGERVDYDGEFFKLRGFKLQVEPVQPRIPIYLATFKPKAVRQTGEIVEGWLPTHVSVRHADTLFGILADGARAAGRDPDEIDTAVFTLVACSDDPETARKLCREHLAYYVGGMGTFYHELMHSYGYGDIADRVLALWKEGDRAGAAQAITRDVLDDIVIAGTREDCLAAIETRRRAGFRHIVVFPPHGIDPEQLAYTLRAVGPANA